jgi:hypothetical protein
MFQFVVFPEVNLLIKFEGFWISYIKFVTKIHDFQECAEVSQEESFRIYIWLCAALDKEIEIKSRLSYGILDSQRNKCSYVRQMPVLERRFDRASLALKLFLVSSQETNVLACPNSDDKPIYATEVNVHCWYFNWNKSAMFSDNAQYERAL